MTVHTGPAKSSEALADRLDDLRKRLAHIEGVLEEDSYVADGEPDRYDARPWDIFISWASALDYSGALLKKRADTAWLDLPYVCALARDRREQALSWRSAMVHVDDTPESPFAELLSKLDD